MRESRGQSTKALPALYRHLAQDYFQLERRAAQLERDLQCLQAQLPAPGAGTILELGCGPGVHAATLSAQGWKVLAVDLSAEMLQIARQDHPGPSYLQGDLAAPEAWSTMRAMAAPFSGAFSLFGVWNYLAEEQAWQLALRELAFSLPAGAPAILEIWLAGPYRRLGRTSTEWTSIVRDNQAQQRRRELIYHERDGRPYLELIHSYRSTGGALLEQDRHWMRLFEPQAFAEAARGAGFVIEQIFQDSTNAPLSPASGGAWLCLRRAASEC
ncbi:MAG: class I SAM-dependent methyltransferase [Leptospirales bacterium]|nr:class I SAM-dependent methyltransferase [Leptospirales bacterium]